MALLKKLQQWMLEANRKYNEDEKENRKTQKKKYYQDHREIIIQRSKKWKEEHLEKRKVYLKKYRQEHLQELKEYRKKRRKRDLEFRKKWEQEHKEERNQRLKERRKIDIKYRLNKNMARDIWTALKGKKAGRKWEMLVGYTIENLIEHLEKQFDDKMNWGNYCSYWTIDHIKPKSLFNYICPEDPEFKECWALKNLQPMEKIENIKKSNKYPYV